MSGRWHLWLGPEVKRPSCEVRGTRWFVFRYTNGELDVWVCLRHGGAIPGAGDAPSSR